MNKIVIRDYYYDCPEGCCGNYGTEVIVNEKLVGTYTGIDEDVVRDILKALDVEAKVEYIYDQQD